MKPVTLTDDECVDLLTDEEFKACLTEKEAIRRGRKKAVAEARANGPSGLLRELSLGKRGDSVLLKGYTRSSQVGPLTAHISLTEGVRLSCKLERSLVDGAPIGVRVTLVSFTR